MGRFNDFQELLKQYAEGSGNIGEAAMLKLARQTILELRNKVSEKEADLEKLKRKAQYVADLAYNKGVRDVFLTMNTNGVDKRVAGDLLLKAPRHEAEFKK